MPTAGITTRLLVVWTLAALWVMAQPVLAQSLGRFDQALAVSDLAAAAQEVEALPLDVSRRLAQTELALVGRRPALAWSHLTAISVGDVPPALASRYFRLRGRLNTSLYPALARRDFQESLARAEFPEELGRAHLASLAFCLEWEQPVEAQKHLRALLELPKQQRYAREGAAALALADGQPEHALLTWQTLAKEADGNSKPLLALTYRIGEADCWDSLQELQRAAALRRDCADRALALNQPLLAALAAETLLPADPTVEQLLPASRDYLEAFLSRLPKIPERALLLAQVGSDSPSDPKLLNLALRESESFDPLVQAYARFHYGVSLKKVKWSRALAEFEAVRDLLSPYEDSWLAADSWSIDRVRLLGELAKTYRGTQQTENGVLAETEALRLTEQYAPVAVSQDAFRQQLLSAFRELDVNRSRAIWERILADFDRAKPSEIVLLLPEAASVFLVGYNTLEDDAVGYNHWRRPGPMELDLAERLRSRPGLVARFLSSCDQAVAKAQRAGSETEISDIWYHRARALTFLGQYAEAERALQQADYVLSLPNSPRRLRLLVLRGTILARTGKLAPELEGLEREIEAVEADSLQKRYPRLLLAKEALLGGRYQAALELVDRALSGGASFQASMLKAEVLEALGRRAEAIALLEAQIHYMNRTRYLSLLLARSGKRREALSANGRVLDSILDLDFPLLKASALLDRAEIQAQSGHRGVDYQAALREFSTVRARLEPLLSKDLFSLSAVGRRLWSHMTTAEKQSVLEPTAPLATGQESDQGENDPAGRRQAFEKALSSLRAQWPSNQDLLDLQNWDFEATQSPLEEGTVLLYPLVLGHGVAWVYQTSDTYGLKFAAISGSDLDLRVVALIEAAESPTSALAFVQGLSSDLAHSLLDPIAEVLQGQTRLVIVPTGSLALLPFELLVDERGHYLVESFQISYRDRLSFDRDNLHPLAGTKLLVYDDASGLAGARAEADAVQGLLDPETLTSENWSSAGFQNLAKTASLIHIAAHGLSTEHDAVNQLSMGQVGLGRDDIKKLELSPGSLVVLGACSGARPNVEPGRRKESLLAAFLKAGAGAAVGAYWEVDDRSAQEFFQSFYQRLLEGESTEVALTAIKRAWLQDPRLSHPFYWAPYVLYR